MEAIASVEILELGEVCGRGGNRQTLPTEVWQTIPGTQCDEGLSCTQRAQEPHSENAFESWYDFSCEEAVE